MISRRAALATILAGAGGVILTACAPRPERTPPTAEPQGTSMPSPTSNRALLVYFSRPGENYSYGDRVNLEVGNTKVAAGMIRDLVDIDEYEIIAADPYPQDYEATVQRNMQEERDDARPAINGQLPDLAAYDTILLGSPVWNVQAPMIMRTFIESVDLTSKTVHPFVTYAVSRIGRVRNDYAEMLPGTMVTEGLAIQGETVRDARSDIQRWLHAIGVG